MSFQNLNGTTKQSFQVGLGGTKIVNNNDQVLEVKDDQDNLSPISIGEALELTHATTKKYVKRRIIKIGGAFDGNTPPNPGDNTGKYLICHTTGGAYTVGKIYYDNGSSLDLVPDDNRFIYIACPDFNGTIAMKEKYIYLYDEDNGNWLTLFDASTLYDGTNQLVIIDIETGATYESTTTISSSAYILRTSLRVYEAYDFGTDIQIKLKNSGSILMDTNQNRPWRTGEYVVSDLIKMPSDDKVEVVIDGNPSNGKAYVAIEFTIPLR